MNNAYPNSGFIKNCVYDYNKILTKKDFLTNSYSYN